MWTFTVEEKGLYPELVDFLKTEEVRYRIMTIKETVPGQCFVRFGIRSSYLEPSQWWVLDEFWKRYDNQFAGRVPEGALQYEPD